MTELFPIIEHPLLLLTYVLACIALTIVPGPTVTVIIANSLRQGPKAGMFNVAGTQTGLIPMILVVAFGLETIVTFMAGAFFWLKLAGGAYLIYMGIKLLRSDGRFGSVDKKAKLSSGRELFWQGFIVIWSNPKALFFLGAFIPQFVDPTGNTISQTIIYGAIFMGVTTILDSAYAFIAGKAGNLLSQKRVRVAEITSGTALIFGGSWLALSKQG